jgi:hypothetical protein
MYFWCLFYKYIRVFFYLVMSLTSYENGVAMVKRLRTTGLYTTTSFFIEKHFYDDMFLIFIDPSSGHISLCILRYCNVITCKLSLR